MIRLIASELKHIGEETQYRVYLTEALRVLTENTGKIAGGSVIKMKYYDIINKNHPAYTETKSGEEIVRDIVGRAGLELA